MQPLPFVSHRATVAFAVAVGCFAVLQLVTGTVTDVRKRRSRADVARLDRGSLQLVVASCAVGVLLGLWSAYHLRGGTIASTAPAVRWAVFVLGLVALVGGSALRLAAILTLGRWFTYDVRVRSDQVVVDRGPYRWVRHPSYTGLLLALAGLGLTMTNWFSLLAMTALPLLGLVRRIRVEEAALLATLGAPYERYAADRPRLVPGIW